jgi:hypothetical protein
MFMEKLINHIEVNIDDEWPCVMYPAGCDQIVGLKMYKLWFVFQA